MLPEWECFAGSEECKRAVHEGCQGQPESGVPRWTPRRAPRLCRVGRGRDSQETAVSPGRVRRASARESPCPTPVVGQQRVTVGSGVTLSLGVGSHPREVMRRA